MTKLLTTPFHARTAERNVANAWVARGAFTVPADYGDATGEALAARVSAVIADITPREELRFEGAGAVALLSAAFGMDIASVPVDAARRVRWHADGGGLRGTGGLSRLGETEFLLRSYDADFSWFATAAPRFGAAVHDVTAERGLLLIGGPFSLPVLAAAGLEEVATLKPGRQAIYDWDGLRVTVLRRAASRAHQLSCAAADGVTVLDRLLKRASLFGARPAGETALDIVQLEQGIALPWVDWTPAREPFAVGPKLDALQGVVLDSDVPAPFSLILRDGVGIGHTLRSAYSPALKRAIALAQITPLTPDTRVIVRATLNGETHEVAARVTALPFL